MPRRYLAPALSLFLALPLLAQTTDHSAHHAAPTDASAATEAFRAANAQMHHAMNVPYTGNPDVDFLTGMIPHHEGAVAMARIILEHGADPEVKAFAQGIIDAQEAEIAWMKAWLARHPQ